MEIEIDGFTFTSNFDSGNLARVEKTPKLQVPVIPPPPKKPTNVHPTQRPETAKASKPLPQAEIPDFEFNLWTKPDCGGTQYENTCRTWFYFGVRGGPPFSLVQLNVIDLNKQGRMYRDGMAPVFRLGTSKTWERVRDRPVFGIENNVFTLSFKYRTSESSKVITYFAFTYPFSYSDSQAHLSSIDMRMGKAENLLPKSEMRFAKGVKITIEPEDEIYYHRELLCHTLEGRRVDLLTISSKHNMTTEWEPRLKNLFPEENTPRCMKFVDKKVVFFSARVHPGETPSSFVLNGLLHLLLSRDDPYALLLRRTFVLKLIPMLNPDGVAKGHYRTDARGVNLNRFYLQPDVFLHSPVYAARALIRYYHFGEEVFDENLENSDTEPVSQSEGLSSGDMASSMETLPMQDLSLQSSHSSLSSDSLSASRSSALPVTEPPGLVSIVRQMALHFSDLTEFVFQEKSRESGLFLYMDFHGHASKKGIFMYGNHFDRAEDMAECMLLPKIMSLNSQNFHFSSCNFSERNMYLRDKRDGASREGSGRVAVLRLTGLVRSYTLECNYNTGRLVNVLPPCSREPPGRPPNNLMSPPKYTPVVYEEVGRAIGISLLDLGGANPWSRISNSDYHTLTGLREWLRMKSVSENFPFMTPKPRRNVQNTNADVRAARTVPAKVPLKSADAPKATPAVKDAAKNTSDVTRIAVVRKIVKNLRGSERQVKPKLDRDPKPSTAPRVVEPIDSGPKLSPKRLKTSAGESRVARMATTSSDPCLSSTSKKLKSSPLKFKKSLEKKRGSERKSKILYKKASKIALSASELAKTDRKRRSPVK